MYLVVDCVFIMCAYVVLDHERYIFPHTAYRQRREAVIFGIRTQLLLLYVMSKRHQVEPGNEMSDEMCTTDGCDRIVPISVKIGVHLLIPQWLEMAFRHIS